MDDAHPSDLAGEKQNIIVIALTSALLRYTRHFVRLSRAARWGTDWCNVRRVVDG